MFFIQDVKPSYHFTYVVQNSSDICGITVRDPTNLSCYLKLAMQMTKKHSWTEEILVNDVEDMNDAMLDNIFVG